MATVFLLPSCCRFWFPMRETGGFLKGWPRFLLLWRSADDTVGGSVEAQSVIITAPPVLHGRPPWNTNECGLFFFLSAQSLFISPCSLTRSSSQFFLLFSYRFLCFQIHLFSSFLVLIPSQSVSFNVCLFPSLLLSLFELGAVSRSELCSHLSHDWGEETSFIDAALLSLFFVSQCLRPFGFCPLHKCHLCCYWGLVFLCFLQSVFGCM